MAKMRPASSLIDVLRTVGMDLDLARQSLDIATEIAKTAARDAAQAGLSERLIARELGVARSRTLRRWLGKA